MLKPERCQNSKKKEASLPWVFIHQCLLRVAKSTVTSLTPFPCLWYDHWYLPGGQLFALWLCSLAKAGFPSSTSLLCTAHFHPKLFYPLSNPSAIWRFTLSELCQQAAFSQLLPSTTDSQSWLRQPHYSLATITGNPQKSNKKDFAFLEPS